MLREATEADVPTLVALVHAAFAEYRGHLDPPSGAEREDEATLTQALVHGGAAVACVDDAVVGCVFYHRATDAAVALSLRPSAREFVYFGRLSVAPAFRRRGVAEALTAWVERRARAMGLRRIQLGVRLALPHLKTYYERLGYRVVRHESHPGYTTPTSVVMEKRLDA